MNSVKYDDLFTFPNLYQTYQRLCKGRMFKGDKIRFEKDIANRLMHLHVRLQKRNYHITSYHDFTIYEPKIRHIHCISFEDKIVQRLVCDQILNEYLVKHSIYDSCAVQKGKGISFANQRVLHHMRSHYQQYTNTGYVLKLDMKDFYASIKQEIVLDTIEHHMGDVEIAQLLKDSITSYPQGLAMGVQCSQIFANLYLDPLDHRIKEYWLIKGYVRYMDDMILIHESQQYLKNVRADIEQFIKPYGLTLNEKKSQLYPIKQGFTFIGWHYQLTESGRIHQRVSKQSVQNVKRKIKDLNHDLKHGRIHIKRYNAKVKGMYAYLKQGNTTGLRRKLMKQVIVKKKEGAL